MGVESTKIGWRKIAGLGVGLVVAGQFAGWNYGLARAGWSDMMTATALVALLCVGLSLCVAELATALPNAGGLYVYCEAAYGPSVGYGVGIAIFAALAVSTGAAAEFISAYSLSVTGYGGPILKFILFAAIIAIHIRGVGEALAVLLVVGFIAVVSLLVFGGAMMPYFDLHNVLPTGRVVIDAGGVFACLPFAIMLLVGVEQTATSAEEARNPARDVPFGILTAVALLSLTAMCVLVLGPGAGGTAHVGMADDPLFAAMASAAGGKTLWLAPFVGAGALLGLMATLFSLIFSASRQLFALGRGGYLPALVARQGRTGTPIVALCAVGLIGFPLSFVSPDKVIVTMVMLLSASYVFTVAGFVRLRRRRPDLPRPFRAPGGVVTAFVVLLLSALVFTACLFENPAAILPILGVLVVATAWYLIGAHPTTKSIIADISSQPVG